VLAAIRPYNNRSLGSVSSIEIDKGIGLISVNGKVLIGFDAPPEEVLTGSGISGDIDKAFQSGDNRVTCGFGMASAALKYCAESGKKVLNFRISLNENANLPDLKINYPNHFREFALFSE
jgi:hypothetical protein